MALTKKEAASNALSAFLYWLEQDQTEVYSIGGARDGANNFMRKALAKFKEANGLPEPTEGYLDLAVWPDRYRDETF
jgi:hypothetical protein